MTLKPRPKAVPSRPRAARCPGTSTLGAALRATLAGGAAVLGVSVACTGAQADEPAKGRPAADVRAAHARVVALRPLHALPTPIASGKTLACADERVEATVPDTAPIRRCPTLPLERICKHADGAADGPRVAFDPDTACRLPRRSESWVAGRREGMSVLWRAVCPGGSKAGDARCVAQVAEIGAYKDGQQSGPWQLYDASGALVGDRNYERGRPQGLWRRLEGGKVVEVVCYHLGKERFRAATGTDASLAACEESVPDGADNGVVEVSEAQTKASRLATLAQQTKNLDLRVRYLKKACDLVPDNAGYKKLLEAAEREARAAAGAPTQGADANGDGG